MPNFTTRLGLPKPLSSEPPDGPDQIGDLAEALDNAAIDLPEATLALRPAASVRGRWFRSSDGGLLYRDRGSAWEQVYTPGSVKFRIGHTYAVPGDIKVPAGDVDFIPPFFVPVIGSGVTKLVGIRHKINAGTSVTYKVQKNGSDLPAAWLGLTIEPTSELIDPADETLADGDRLAMVVTAVSGSPKNLSVTLILEVAI